MINQNDINLAHIINAGQAGGTHIVESNGNTYICLARPDRPDAMLADKVWQVRRIDADGNSIFAATSATTGATKAFIHAATAPASLTYHARA